MAEATLLETEAPPAATEATQGTAPELSDEQEATALLEEVEGTATEAREGTARATESTAPVDPDEQAALEEIRASARREGETAAEARIREENEANAAKYNEAVQLARINEAYTNRAQDVRKLQAEEDWTEEQAQKVWNLLNQDRAVVAPAVTAQMYNAVLNRVAQRFGRASRDELAQKYAVSPTQRFDWDGFMESYEKRVETKALEGHVSESSVKSARADGMLAYKRALEKDLKDDPTGAKLLARFKSRLDSPQGRSQGTPSADDRSRLMDPTTPITEIERIRARQRAAGG